MSSTASPDDQADLRSAAGIATALTRRTPIDERERWSIELFLATLAELTDPFGERDGGRHVTVSAIIVGPRGVVLHRHKRLGIWLQPGGHVDPGESPADAARREAEEETGLVVRHPDGGPRLVHVDVHPGPRCAAHLDLRFLLEAGDEDPHPGEDESQDVAWFTWDDALAVADAGLVGALRATRGDAGGRPAPR